MKIVILGLQGSGKGTQADLIAEKFHIPHISSGDLFRKIMEEDSDFGKMIKELINNGNLVPDETTIEIIKKRIGEQDCVGGFILDGFPRTFAQASALSHIAKIDFAINIIISQKEALKRLGSRLQCHECNAVFSTLQNPKISEGDKCEKCAGILLIRDDDKPDAINSRIAAYSLSAGPVIGYYQKMHILHTIKGEQPVEKVFKDIQKVLGK